MSMNNFGEDVDVGEKQRNFHTVSQYNIELSIDLKNVVSGSH